MITMLAARVGSVDSSLAGDWTVIEALKDRAELNAGKAAFSGGAIGAIAAGCCTVPISALLIFLLKRSGGTAQGAETQTSDELNQLNAPVDGEWGSLTTLETSQTVIEGFYNPVSADGPNSAVGEMGAMLLGDGANQLWE
jgi:hypothetical protein